MPDRSAVKILYLNVIAAIGGAERVLLDLMTSVLHAQPSAELHLLTPADGPLTAAARNRRIATAVLPMPNALLGLGDSGLVGPRRSWSMLRFAACGLPASVAAWRYARSLDRFVERLRPDVVHSNSLKLHMLTAMARLRQSCLVWHLHDFLGARPVMARALRWASRRPQGAIAVSRAVGDDAASVVPGLPITVVPNAIDTNHFAPGPGDGRRLDGLAGLSPAGPETVRVGLVATFARWKGHDVFLEAAAQVARSLGDQAARFYIVGGPIYQTGGSQWSLGELKERAARLLGHGAVGFVQFQADPVSVYRDLDIVVHASTRPEPFGLTIAEAMACGRAVVVTQSGGATEQFTPDYDAIGVPASNVQALAEAVQALSRDPQRRQRLGTNARHSVVERSGRDRLGKQVLSAYEAFQQHGAQT
jgi:glycosyltransferase involved in cell wall biosynthesis